MDQSEQAEKERRARPRRKVSTEEEQHQTRLARRRQQAVSPRTAAADDCDIALTKIAVEVNSVWKATFEVAGRPVPWLTELRRDIGELRKLLAELNRSKKGDRCTLKLTYAIYEEIVDWRQRDRVSRETVIDLCKRLRISRPTFYRLLTLINDGDEDYRSPIMERCRVVIARMAKNADELCQVCVRAKNPSLLLVLEWIRGQMPFLMGKIAALDRAKKGTRPPVKVTDAIRERIAAWHRQDAATRETITAMCRRLKISRPTFRKVLREVQNN